MASPASGVGHYQPQALEHYRPSRAQREAALRVLHRRPRTPRDVQRVFTALADIAPELAPIGERMRVAAASPLTPLLHGTPRLPMIHETAHGFVVSLPRQRSPIRYFSHLVRCAAQLLPSPFAHEAGAFVPHGTRGQWTARAWRHYAWQEVATVTLQWQMAARLATAGIRPEHFPDPSQWLGPAQLAQFGLMREEGVSALAAAIRDYLLAPERQTIDEGFRRMYAHTSPHPGPAVSGRLLLDPPHVPTLPASLLDPWVNPVRFLDRGPYEQHRIRTRLTGAEIRSARRQLATPIRDKPDVGRLLLLLHTLAPHVAKQVLPAVYDNDQLVFHLVEGRETNAWPDFSAKWLLGDRQVGPMHIYLPIGLTYDQALIDCTIFFGMLDFPMRLLREHPLFHMGRHPSVAKIAARIALSFAYHHTWGVATQFEFFRAASARGVSLEVTNVFAPHEALFHRGINAVVAQWPAIMGTAVPNLTRQFHEMATAYMEE